MLAATPDLPPNGLRRGGLVAGELDSFRVVPPLSVEKTNFFGFFYDTYHVMICYTCYFFSLCKYVQSDTMIFVYVIREIAPILYMCSYSIG
jgi:hypothetical protein